MLSCFNKHMKITPELWAVWMRVLTRAPNAVLWLLRFPRCVAPHASWVSVRVRVRVRVS